MKKILAIGTTFALLPLISSAQIAQNGSGGDLGNFMFTILGFIQGIIIPFLLGIGFLLFVWGMFLYFIKGGHSDEAQETGKSLILYAIAGYVVIFAFWGLVNIINDGLGFDNSLNETYLPEVIPDPV